jgi:hypothetical protein
MRELKNCCKHGFSFEKKKSPSAYHKKEKDKEWNIVRRRMKEEEESAINNR